ncbi:kinase-like protein [Karstenula rhodostoma CBS 690.94]|uniref:Kinase-like protein n=1 Tax=Karstenula rhodostoma CBS 690.94 TaxID=1392251 RepID=A0A9P4U5L8_9PLEO|nr:kinase-like protein [Karstenula rhodostoma CBS 690.94]
MPPLPAPALQALATTLQSLLSTTPYACTSLTQLTGGTTSFVFLGTLTTPLVLTSPSGVQRTEETVIIKHAAPFASIHTDFLVDAGRVKYEAAMLGALRGFRPGGDASGVEVPEVYWYDAAGKVLVIQYIPATVPLHKNLHSLSTSEAARIGHALGTWLKAFHAWCEEPAQEGLKEMVEGNREEVDLKWKLTWGQGTEVLDTMEDVVGKEERAAWDKASASAWEEKEVRDNGVVHGDFWAGNVLIPHALPAQENAGELQLSVIDFEFTHLSPASTDLAQFLGSLLELSYTALSPPPSTLPLLTAFLAGYGPLSEDLKWRTAIYVGAFVVNWWSRGPPGRQDVDAERRERGVELAKKGVGWVRSGWERDLKAFEGGPLWVLFTG